MERVDREQIVAFRLGSHNLGERLPAERLLDAVGACGVQNTPPGVGTLALRARVDGLTPELVDRALTKDRALLLIWSVRGAPHLVPTRDVTTFCAGALPADEESLSSFIQGVWAPLVASSGFSGFETVDAIAAAMDQALAGVALTKGELSTAVGRLVPAGMLHWCESCGTRHVPEPLFRAVGMLGRVCLDGDGRGARLVRVEDWLGKAPPRVTAANRAQGRADLARRFLRCYGPSTPGYFAEWMQVSQADAHATFDRLAGELAEVRSPVGGGVMLASDLPALRSAVLPEGVRLLPPHDPFLQQRDRETLLPDAAHRRRVWRSLGAPGIVLAAGHPVATWRHRKQGRKLAVTVEPLTHPARMAIEALEAETATIAPFRGCETATVAMES